MTVEGQRYLEECRKVLKEEQMDAVSMGLDFGLPVSDIQKVVKSNQEAPVMKAIIIGLMEGIGEIDFLCEGNYNQFQVREIVEGLKNGLDLEEVKTYAGNELPASRMRTMRIQLEEAKAKKEAGEENLIPVVKPTISEMPFEWYITLSNGLWWKKEKTIHTHDAAGVVPEYLRADPSAILLLKGEL